MKKIIPFSLELRQQLPEINASKEYAIFRNQLERMDEIINSLKLEKIFMEMELNKRESKRKQEGKPKLTNNEKIEIEKLSIKKLRCVICRNLLQESYEKFSVHLADSMLLQNFCRLNVLGKIKIPSSSSLQRYEKNVPVELLEKLIGKTIITDEETAEQLKIGIISTIKIYFDTTCLETNIHFPVDWLLLRDAVRTLILAVKLIRNEGLKNRMASPQKFITEMNNVCIKMTHTRRKRNGKKHRKKILRLMKKILKKISHHAITHYELLIDNWYKTHLSENETLQILQRMKNILSQLPDAIHQAHERIIGERIVASSEKLLSLYEVDTNVIVRGKSSAEVEFGNKLLIGELENGLIMYYKMYKNGSPSDSGLLPKALEKIKEISSPKNCPKIVITDRGFVGNKNEKYLSKNGIRNYIFPRSKTKLADYLKDPEFCMAQTRRSQTEGRIGILKNKFGINSIRSKGFESREKTLGWSILTHNIWVLARLNQNDESIELVA